MITERIQKIAFPSSWKACNFVIGEFDSHAVVELKTDNVGKIYHEWLVCSDEIIVFEKLFFKLL